MDKPPLPTIVIAADGAAAGSLVSEIQFGCEEYGVPSSVVFSSGESDELGREAAAESELSLGIGIGMDARITLWDQRCLACALISVPRSMPADARRIGQIAGRLVRGFPVDHLTSPARVSSSG